MGRARRRIHNDFAPADNPISGHAVHSKEQRIAYCLQPVRFRDASNLSLPNYDIGIPGEVMLSELWHLDCAEDLKAEQPVAVRHALGTTVSSA